MLVCLFPALYETSMSGLYNGLGFPLVLLQFLVSSMLATTPLKLATSLHLKKGLHKIKSPQKQWKRTGCRYTTSAHPDGTTRSPLNLLAMQELWTTLRRQPPPSETTTSQVKVASLPSGLRWLTEDSRDLYLRPCYPELYKKVMGCNTGAGQGAVVLGSPGIGKSWFLSYCFYRLATDPETRHKSILFESVESGKSFFFDAQTESVSTRGDSRTDVALRALMTANSVYLFDPYHLAGREPTPFDSFTIITPSPHIAYYQTFQARLSRKDAVFYMPVWSWNEVVSLHELLPHDLPLQVVAERYLVFGGLPGTLFRQDCKEVLPEDSMQQLDEAIASIRTEDLDFLRFIDDPAAIEARHWLVQYHPGPYFTDYYTDWSSKAVGKGVYDRLTQRKEREWTFTTWIESLSQVHPSYTYWNGLLEHHVHFGLPTHGPVPPHPIRVFDGEHWGPETTLELPELRHVMVDGWESAKVENNTYYQSKYSNPAIDAVIRVDDIIYLLHITLNNCRLLSDARFEEQVQHFKSPSSNLTIKFVFVTNKKVMKEDETMFTAISKQLRGLDLDVLLLGYSQRL